VTAPCDEATHDRRAGGVAFVNGHSTVRVCTFVRVLVIVTGRVYAGPIEITNASTIMGTGRGATMRRI
jgi:hypothetical protein